MIVYCTISLFLWYFGYLSVLYQTAVAGRTKPSFRKCIEEMCWQDTSGYGTIADEPLADYITPNSTILINQNATNFTGSRNGDIVLYLKEDKARLSSAVLGTTIFRRRSDGTFLREISGPEDYASFGYMQVERPVPDPDTTFENLGRDPLLADIPESLRSAVDPALLLPSYNESCGPKKWLVSVAVRPKIQLVRLVASDIVEVCRGLLLRSRTNEYGLPVQHY